MIVILLLIIGFVIFAIWYIYMVFGEAIQNFFKGKNPPKENKITYGYENHLEKIKANEYFIQGYDFFYQGDYKNALVNYDAGIKLDKTNAVAYFIRALCVVRTGKPELAVFDFKDALRCDPGNAMYRKYYRISRNQTAYLMVMGIARIVLSYVGPAVSGIIGGIIGSKSGGVIRIAIGAGIGTVAAMITGIIVMGILGWIGNKFFYTGFDLIEVMKAGQDAVG